MLKTEVKAKKRRPTPHKRAKASTTDIVGGVKTLADEVPAKWRHYFNKLLDLRRHYRSQKGRLKQDAAESYTGPRRNEADVASNTYDRDWALGMAASDQDVLFDITQALDRIRNGTYGICELTGKPIPRERLEAVPWTRFTTQAEKELERRGQMERDKSRLGPRERVPKEKPPEAYGNEAGDLGEEG